VLSALLLGLGLGANIAVLSVLKGALFADLPYRDSERLVMLWRRQQSSGDMRILNSWPDFRDMRPALTSAEQLAALRTQTYAVTSLPEPISVPAIRVTPNLLSVLGVRVLAGRDFRAEDARADAVPVAMVSERFCKLYLDGRCGLQGQLLTLDGQTHEIVGVVAESVELERMRGIAVDPFDIWIPLAPQPDEETRTLGLFWVFARLDGDATIQGLQAELDAYYVRRADEDPERLGGAAGEVQPIRDALTGTLRRPLLVALSASALLLFAATLSFTSLVVAHRLEDLGQTAVRRALGASPTALARITACEVSILVGAGFIAAAVLAFATLRVVQALGARAGIPPEALGLQAPAFALGALAAIAVIVTVTVAVSRKISRLPLTPYLKGAGKGSVGSGSHTWPMAATIVAQIAIGIAVLSLGGFLYGQLLRAKNADPGFVAENLWAISLVLPNAQYPDDQSRLAFLDGLESDLRQRPGIEAAGTVWRSAPGLPGLAGVNATPEGFEGRSADVPLLNYRVVTPGYLTTLVAPVRAGRNFESADVIQNAIGMVVSTSVADLFWPDGDAVGMRLKLSFDDDPWRSVVGVVDDQRLLALDAPAEKTIFVLMSQNTWPEFLSVVTLVVRTALPESSLGLLITDAIRSRDPDLPIRRLARVDDALQGSLAKRAFVSTLILVFAAMTAVVVVLGIYGQFAQASARRLRELAVRRVLGATPSRVLADVARTTVLLCLAGAVLGGLLAHAITRVGRAFLLDATPSDFGVSALGALLVLAAALTAASIPVAAAARKPIAAVLRAQP
jgi:predicted permease